MFEQTYKPNTNNSTTDLDRATQDKIIPWQNPIGEDEHTRVFMDGFPVTSGHRLYVPKWNTPYGIWHAFRAAQEHGDDLVRNKTIDGYNLGINQGKSAGQTVMYPHVHFIPRRDNDCEDPVGGVRGVIAGQANYRSKSYRAP